jgi:5'-3' exonuclease
VSPPSRLLLLDSPSLTYRAFFALPASIRSPSGQPVNAVRGYLDMVSRLLTDRRPAGAVHTFDADWRPQWRVDAYPGYKAARRPDPPELEGQFDILLEVLDAAGLPVLSAPGYEADDVIGTLATRASASAPVDIVTGDRDLLQLVRDPAVRVLFTVRGVRELGTFDEAAVQARYGIPAARYADFASLRGDPSDGLPGVSGVGETTAARLIATHGSLAAVMAAVDEQPPRLRTALQQARDYLEAMGTVVPVATDLNLVVPAPRPPDEARLAALGERHAIEGPVQRLLAALAGS